MRCTKCRKNKCEEILIYYGEAVCECSCKFCGFTVLENCKGNMIDSWKNGEHTEYKRVLEKEDAENFVFCVIEYLTYDRDQCVDDDYAYGVDFVGAFADTEFMKLIKDVIAKGNENCKNMSFKENQLVWDSRIDEDLFLLLREHGYAVEIAERHCLGSSWCCDDDCDNWWNEDHGDCWVLLNGDFDHLHRCFNDWDEMIFTEDEWNEYCDEDECDCDICEECGGYIDRDCWCEIHDGLDECECEDKEGEVEV